MRSRLLGRSVEIKVGPVTLEGDLAVPEHAQSIVIFVQGGGSSRCNPHHRLVAQSLNKEQVATLLVDLLTVQEQEQDAWDRLLCSDMVLMTRRLLGVTDWLESQPETRGIRLGLFGTDTGSGAVMNLAGVYPHLVDSVVVRGGHPEMAGNALKYVQAPTLFIVGTNDPAGLGGAHIAHTRLGTFAKHVEMIPQAGFLYEERGVADQVARLTRQWFEAYLVDYRQFARAA
jgi:putative phosphoribosyl transferase